MKKMNTLATTALAAGGLLLLGSFAAKAQDVLSPQGTAPNEDDLIAAFYVPDGAGTGGGNSYEVDLGPLSSLGSSDTFSLNSDLTSIFGTWASRNDVFWTVFGDNINTGEFWALDTGTGLHRQNAGTQGTVTGNMDGFYSDLDSEPYISSGDKTAANLSNSADPSDIGVVFSSSGITDPTQWGYGSEWGTGVDKSNADSSAAIGFYDVAPIASGSPLAPEVGAFSLASNGNLTFTAAAVPEPSTWASIIVGAAGLLAFRRRRMARA
jgi:PEP-CTERM motif-containing protein